MATEEPGAGGIERGEMEKDCSGSVANCVSCSDGDVVLQSIIEPLRQASRPARPALDNLRFAVRQAFMAQPAKSVKLQPPTVEAFDAYIRQAEAQMEHALDGTRPFLWCDLSPESAQQVH